MTSRKPFRTLDLLAQGERRQRLRASEPCTVWVREEDPSSTFQRAQSLDLSEDGLRVSLRNGLSRGTNVVVSLKLAMGNTVTYTGQVVWARPNAEFTHSISGIQLEETSEADRLRYTRWLAGRAVH